MNGFRERRSAGFTLVELIVALTIIGIMSAGLFSALRLTARGWERGEARAVALNDADAVRSFLRGRISAAELAFIPVGPDSQEPAFIGQPDRLRFAAAMPPEVGNGGLYLFTVETDGFPGEVMLDWRLIRDRALIEIEDGRLRPRPLLSGGARIALRYFGVPAADEADITDPFWSEDWGNGSKLPQLIEIRFLDETGAETAPPLVIALVNALYSGI